MLQKKALGRLLLLLAICIGLSSCAKRRFDKQEFEAQATADVYTKPKVDIIFFQDTSSGTIRALPAFKSQFDQFVLGLAEEMDFRIVVLPLQGNADLRDRLILASDCGGVSSQFCMSAEERSNFNNASSGSWLPVDPSNGSFDEAFFYIKSNLTNAVSSSTNFLRPDALLATVVFTNGNDATDVAYTKRVDGQVVVNPSAAQTIASENDFRDFLLGNAPYANILKIGPGLSQFFAVVAPYRTSNCNGDEAFQGWRYTNIASHNYSLMGQSYYLGRTYDICGAGLQNTLNDIHVGVKQQIKAFIFNYVVLTDDPVEDSIKVFKNGDEVPRDDTNGWSFEGYKSDFPTAIFPQASQNRTGYFIRMNGNAQYSGDDVIDIDYQKK